MKIVRVTWQHRNDYEADMECEHCGAKDVDKSGYNDANYHDNVIPRFHCPSCGKDRAGNLRVLAEESRFVSPPRAVEPSYGSPAAWPFPFAPAPTQYTPEPEREPALVSGGGGNFGGGGASSSWGDSSSSSSSSSDSSSSSSSDSGSSCSSSD